MLAIKETGHGTQTQRLIQKGCRALIALSSVLMHKQVSADLGIGLSTPNKWVKAFSEEFSPAEPDQSVMRENERLRREN
jgi:hypothetical protein